MVSKGRGIVQGFSLFELMVVMVIVVTIISFSVAGWQDLLAKVRVMSVTHDLLSVLESTRYEALSGRRSLKVCAFGRAGENLCEMPWRGRLGVFDDRNGNGQPDADEAVMINMPFLTDDFYLNWRSFRGEAFLEWNTKGYAAASNGTFTLCNALHDERLLRQFVINRAGRVRLVYSARRGGESLQRARTACGW